VYAEYQLVVKFKQLKKQTSVKVGNVGISGAEIPKES